MSKKSKPKPLMWGTDEWRKKQTMLSLKAMLPPGTILVRHTGPIGGTMVSKSKPKPASVGEKIMRRYFNARGTSGDTERLIDTAIRRAVKEAHQNGHDLGNPSCSLKLATERKERIERKYGIKL